jgi:dihydrofolate reductase
MRKLVLSMHVSLDGFVADKNREMEWVHVNDQIFDYAGYLTDEADTALYGHNTFRMMEAYWPTAGDNPAGSKHDIQHSAWYNQVEKVVLSRSIKATDRPDIKIISDHLAEEVQKIKTQPGKNIIVFGSPSAGHSLMQFNLIDDYWLFVNPVLLGSGIPLFKNIKDKTKLKLAEAKAFDSGVVGLHYTV